MSGVGRCDTRHTGHEPEKHAEEVGPAHVRMHHVDLPLATNGSDPPQLIRGQTILIGKDKVHAVGVQLSTDP
jgi:hypothetical protein